MVDITSANAVLMMSVPGIFNVPQQIEGFATDDIYDLDEIEAVETMMGVDGNLSGGFVWKVQPQTVTLQADSPSVAFFDAWQTNQQAGIRTYVANGVITIPNLGKKFIQTKGYLKGYKLPGAKRLMQPQRFRIEWQTVVAAPA